MPWPKPGLTLIPTVLHSIISIKEIYITIFLGSIWNIPYISTYGVSFSPFICGYNSLKSFNGGWNELFGG